MAEKTKAKLREAANKVGVKELANQIRESWATQEAVSAIQAWEPVPTWGGSWWTQIDNVAEWFQEGDAAIPWVNVNVEGWTSKETFDKTNEIEDVESPEQAWTEVEDAIKSGMTENVKQQEEVAALAAKRNEEDKNIKEERTEDVENFYDDIAEVRDEKSESFEEIEARQRNLIEQRKIRDADLLEEQKEAELTKLEREREMQEVKDKQAILDAERDVEISKQQSAWAYQKLWLAFSSGIINTSQQIATDWATEIAALKVQANYNQADIAYKASQIEFQYTSDINGMIDTYTNAQLDLEESVKQRIFDEQENRLKDDFEKEETIKQIEEEYITKTREREDSFRRETERLRNKQIENAQALKQEMLAEEERQKTNLNDMLISGDWYRLSPEEQMKRARQAGYEPDTVNKLLQNSVQTESYNIAQNSLWKDFMFSKDENRKIQTDVQTLINSWVGLAEAIDRATNNVIKNNPRYAEIKKIRDMQEKDALDKLRGTGRYAPTSSKTSAAEVYALGDIYWVNLTKDQVEQYVNSWLTKTEIEETFINPAGSMERIEFKSDNVSEVIKNIGDKKYKVGDVENVVETIRRAGWTTNDVLNSIAPIVAQWGIELETNKKGETIIQSTKWWWEDDVYRINENTWAIELIK